MWWVNDRLNNWATSETIMKMVVLRSFVANVLGQGSKCSSFSGVLIGKEVVLKGMVAIPFFNLLVVVVGGGCWYQITKRGVAKNL